MISRRQFVTTSLALSALGASASTAFASQRGGAFDVVIVGAGPAGIGAALELRAAHKKFIMLEARGRIGGRTFTDTTSFPGIAWDQGGQWCHQVTPNPEHPNLSNNPLFNIARARGIPVFPDLNPRLLLHPPQLAVNILDSPVLPVLGAAATELLSAGYLASLYPRMDVSVARATADLRNESWYDLTAALLQTHDGATLEQMGCRDLYSLSRTGIFPVLTPSIDNWLIPSGLGTLVTSLAAGMPISTSTPVTAIRWGSKHGVALDTPQGTVSAKAVIVTAPIGTLTSGNPRFSPDLPERYSRAIHGLKMGHTAKIGMLFAPDYSFDVPQDNTFVMPFAHGNEAPLVQTRAFGHKNFAIVIIGGQQVVDLEVRGQLVPYALDQLVGMFGSRTRDAFRKGVASSWNTDPLTLGGYSYAPPGAVPFRAQLAQPLAKQVFFAGEAVSIGSHSAAHGAFISGHYAAKKAIEAIG